MTNRFVEAARARLYGSRQVGLSPREIKANVRLGPERDEEWPGSQVGVNPVAKALREATETAE